MAGMTAFKARASHSRENPEVVFFRFGGVALVDGKVAFGAF
jgi:hypothetical protein